MGKILIVFVFIASGSVSADEGSAFDSSIIEAFGQIIDAQRAQSENRQEEAAAAIERQTEAAREMQGRISRLESEITNVRRVMQAAPTGDRLSQAVQALSSQMSGLTFAATQSAGAIAKIKQGLRGGDMRLFDKAVKLRSAASEVKKRGRVAADDICLRVVLPLREMRRVEEVRMLAGGAPAMKSAATRMSIEADDLVDFLSGNPRPGPSPADPIPNFCNPEDIPPHR